jgi:long-chain fatty acid transport protein
MTTGRFVFCAALGLSSLTSIDARAAGLYFAERGVRPLARGGAFTAAANDLHAIWYNPAGVYEAGEQFLFDASLLLYATEYTRRARLKQVDPNTGGVVSEHEQVFPTVHGTSSKIPIPTIAGSYRVHPDWVLAVGLEAPYAAITSYPETVGGEPAPQRYSLLTLDGSALAILGLWAGYAPNEQWRIGAGLQMLVGKFQATTMFSGCVPDRFFCAPEQPDWDTLAELSAGPIFTPSGNLGVLYKPAPKWRLGGAFQLPFFVRTSGTIRSRLPATPVFENAEQLGDEVTVSFELPWSLRLGVEYAVLDDLRMELDASVEGWGIHDEIRVEPENVRLRGVVGFPDDYPLPNQSIVRGFQDSFSVRVGGEWDIEVASAILQPRLGVSFESSAVPKAYLSVLTVDVPKVTMGLGAGVYLGAWRFDAVYAHVVEAQLDVSTEEARVPLQTPIEANQPEPHYVNAGNYHARAHVVGIGMAYSFDGPIHEATKQRQQTLETNAVRETNAMRETNAVRETNAARETTAALPKGGE